MFLNLMGKERILRGQWSFSRLTIEKKKRNNGRSWKRKPYKNQLNYLLRGGKGKSSESFGLCLDRRSTPPDSEDHHGKKVATWGASVEY